MRSAAKETRKRTTKTLVRKGRPKEEGLHRMQLRVLAVLFSLPGNSERNLEQLAEKAGISPDAVRMGIGPVHPENREAHEERHGFKCLLSLSLIGDRYDDELGQVYSLTDHGRRMSAIYKAKGKFEFPQRNENQFTNKNVEPQQDQEPGNRLIDAYTRFTPEQLRQIEPSHNKLSNTFKAWLSEQSATQIAVEKQQVDIRCHHAHQSYLFELKICYQQATRLAIREALGQSLEYSHYPGRTKPDHLAIVLDSKPSHDDVEWLRQLNVAGLAIELFWVIDCDVYSANVTKNPLSQRAKQG